MKKLLTAFSLLLACSCQAQMRRAPQTDYGTLMRFAADSAAKTAAIAANAADILAVKVMVSSKREVSDTTGSSATVTGAQLDSMRSNLYQAIATLQVRMDSLAKSPSGTRSAVFKRK